jgi:hypothetical protein
MFEWNVEECKLIKEIKGAFPKPRYEEDFTFKTERELNTAEKIEFIDSITNGRCTKLLALLQKYKDERDTLPKDPCKFGTDKTKTVSLKAWLKRNDDEGFFDREYHYGHIRPVKDTFLSKGTRGRISTPDSSRIQDACENPQKLVDYMFHSAMLECLRAEKQWFRSHDEHSIVTDQFIDLDNSGKFYHFGLVISYGSGGINIHSSDASGKERPLSTAELKRLIEFNRKVEEYAESLSSELGFSYDKPLDDKSEKERD